MESKLKNSLLLVLVGCALLYLLLCVNSRGHVSNSNPVFLPSVDQHVGVTQDSTNYQVTDKTFVRIYFYSGQQAFSIRDIVSLQCFLRSLDHQFALVEPYFIQSVIRGYVDDADDDILKFSDIFDIDHFNTESRLAHSAEMVTMEEFTTHSPNQVILILASYHTSKAEVLWQSDAREKCINQDKLSKLLNDNSKLDREALRMKLGSKLVKMLSENCVVRVVIFLVLKKHNSLRYSDSIMNLLFQDWLPQDVTLVFQRWKGQDHVTPESDGEDCEQEFLSNYYKSLFKPSKKLLQDVKTYEEKFLGNRNRLAVMLRVERTIKFYFRMEQNIPSEVDTLEKCFHEVLTLAKELEGGQESVYPLVTLDIGQYGSKSFHPNATVIEQSHNTLMTLYHNKWSVRGWEESFAMVVGDDKPSAYVAALQRLLASRAECLILMGGGNFQALAVEDYYDYHEGLKEKCVYIICAKSFPHIHIDAVDMVDLASHVLVLK